MSFLFYYYTTGATRRCGIFITYDLSGSTIFSRGESGLFTIYTGRCYTNSNIVQGEEGRLMYYLGIDLGGTNIAVGIVNE